MDCRQDLIFDVGFHKGEDTDFYLRLGFNVIAFEANPDLVEECRRRFPTEMRSGQLTIVEGAIAKDGAEKTVPFFVNRRKSEWGTANASFVARNLAYGAPSAEVIVNSIDVADAFNRFGTPYYLKIDIEGSD